MVFLYAENIPSKGYAVVKDSPFCNLEAPRVSGNKLSNEFFELTFNEKNDLVSFIDKRCGREILPAPAGLRVYEDYPYNYDAWELSDYYRDKCWLVDDIHGVS